ncbi:hypothetical protein CFT12S00416_02485 [Campylobacter fetus subsp. testudinum]|uniref:hypothetical protein n=1 Tax=Campylobacter fetus TaxID=196 RepID=UPI000818A39D|nr:hypothetical protein [Campylobacter fetus]AVK80553.1 hypothetical protein C6B32_01460 [Campylobacter fetus subsp. testudinum]OCR89573.1 hypothetical protein CFT12S00416_02485 [Campylobacter fetus subsp. testudinum]OCS00825.1 hypothetical protein A9K75_02355 [Campylobacter fetus subsp. testudinum]OCS05461.1 hypothetical protein AC237_02500 [Campylobacter fetus subsp. testudinum]
MKKIVIFLVFCIAVFAKNLKIDFISEDGLKLTINSKDYLALNLPCKDWKIGDELQILSGDKDARCLNAAYLNLRTKTSCELLCDAK